jgi:hypothetical protein
MVDVYLCVVVMSIAMVLVFFYPAVEVEAVDENPTVSTDRGDLPRSC